MTGTAPDIFQYDDYRLFIHDQIEYLRVSKNKSLRSLDVTKPDGKSYSPQFISQIVTGKRGLPTASVSSFATALHLSAHHAKALDKLVTLSDNDDPKRKKLALRSLAKMRDAAAETAGQPTANHISEVNFLTTPLVGDIYLLSARSDFEASPKWIRENLAIRQSLSDISAAIDILVDLGLFVCQDGQARRTENSRPRPDHRQRQLVDMYHLSQAHKAADSIEACAPKQRMFHTWGLANFTEEGHREFQNKLKAEMEILIQKLATQYEAKPNDKNATVVAQVNIQSFAVSNVNTNNK